MSCNWLILLWVLATTSAHAQRYLRTGFEPVHVPHFDSITSFAVSHDQLLLLAPLPHNTTQPPHLLYRSHPHQPFQSLSTPFHLHSIRLEGSRVCGLDSRDHLYCTWLSFPLDWVKLPGLFIDVDMDQQRLCAITPHHQVYCTLYTGHNRGSWFLLSSPPLVSISIHQESACGITRNASILCTDSIYSPVWKDVSHGRTWSRMDIKGSRICGISDYSIYCYHQNDWVLVDATFPALQLSVKNPHLMALDTSLGLFYTTCASSASNPLHIWTSFLQDLPLDSILDGSL